MATVSLTKDFVVRDEKAFEQFKKDLETNSSKNRTVNESPTLSTARRNAEQIPCFFVGGKRLWAKEVIDKWAKQGGCPKEKEEQK